MPSPATSRNVALLVVQAPAKVNLTLDVVGRRSDGYHFIESVMQTVDLADYVTLTPVSASPAVASPSSRSEARGRGVALPIQTAGFSGSVVRCVGNGVNADGVPTDETNLASRAVEALWAAVKGGHASHEPGGMSTFANDLSIHIDKRIPVAAGLGGGSANAAAALIGANLLWELHFERERLASIGVSLGADIPFCLYGGTAVARGIGEKLAPLPETEPMAGVIVTPDFQVSTAKVYRLYDEWNGEQTASAAQHERVAERTDAMVTALADGDVHRVASLLYNGLERVTTRLHPEVGQLRDGLERAGALGVVMCGSGPSVFGLAEDEDHAADIAARLARPGLFVTTCRFFGSGSRLIEQGGGRDGER